MTEITFHDCEYKYIENNEIQCKNKQGLKYTNNKCDNCTENIHLNCENYNPQKDYCLKYFTNNISKNNKECKEKTTHNDKQLQKKWSN